jgi:hypothetical protein
MVCVDFVAVEKIASANQIVLGPRFDKSLAEAKIKSAIKDSESKTRNDPVSLECQLIIDCANDSPNLIYEVT